MIVVRAIPSFALVATAVMLTWLAARPADEHATDAQMRANFDVRADDVRFLSTWVHIDEDGCVTRCDSDVAAEFPSCSTTCPGDQ